MPDRRHDDTRRADADDGVALRQVGAVPPRPKVVAGTACDGIGTTGIDLVITPRAIDVVRCSTHRMRTALGLAIAFVARLTDTVRN